MFAASIDAYSVYGCSIEAACSCYMRTLESVTRWNHWASCNDFAHHSSAGVLAALLHCTTSTLTSEISVDFVYDCYHCWNAVCDRLIREVTLHYMQQRAMVQLPAYCCCCSMAALLMCVTSGTCALSILRLNVVTLLQKKWVHCTLTEL
jgi:hypothetical protein